jgi:hypothetical protein
MLKIARMSGSDLQAGVGLHLVEDLDMEVMHGRGCGCRGAFVQLLLQQGAKTSVRPADGAVFEGVSDATGAAVVNVWSFLCAFRQPLCLSPMSLDDLSDALRLRSNVATLVGQVRRCAGGMSLSRACANS